MEGRCGRQPPSHRSATKTEPGVVRAGLAPSPNARIGRMDRGAARTGNGVFCAEGIVTLRIVCAFIAVVLLADCNRDAGETAIPPPVELNSDAMGVFCGMNVLEHPGPKGQIITASRIDPFWFTSVRDTVAFTLLPDQPRDIRAIYVSDMGRAPSWEEPRATNWIDARKAFFVIQSRRQGGMGAAEAVPFGDRAAAAVFAAANGGDVVTFAQIPSTYVLGSDAAGDQTGQDRSDVSAN
jgi:copper chaperone NosL